MSIISPVFVMVCDNVQVMGGFSFTQAEKAARKGRSVHMVTGAPLDVLGLKVGLFSACHRR